MMTSPTSVTEIQLTASLSGRALQTVFDSPDLYPNSIDFQKRLFTFVRMSRDSYHNSVFLDQRTLYLGVDVYGIRIDDLLLRARSVTPALRKVHYIFHPPYSCSTLLARYFEVLPCCLVLKEPRLLTQMALVGPESSADWNEVLHLCVRLLTRTYQPDDFVVIKPHEPCSALAERLLTHDENATATFLLGPLRQFVLALLKTPGRRAWVRTRIPAAAVAAQCRSLTGIRSEALSDAQAAAYLWLVNRMICEQCVARCGAQVRWLDQNQLVDFPRATLNALVRDSKLSLSDSQITTMLEHPTAQTYSKDPSRPYNAFSRRKELAELEKQFGAEADSAFDWVAAHGMERFLL